MYAFTEGNTINNTNIHPNVQTLNYIHYALFKPDSKNKHLCTSLYRVHEKR